MHNPVPQSRRSRKDPAMKPLLTLLAAMERHASAAWTDVPLKPLQAREPKMCLEEGAD